MGISNDFIHFKDKPLHFEREEYDKRVQKTLSLMEKRNLDGMLIFRQESMYYLTGFDTFGYCFFQCLYLRSDGEMTLLTREPDRLQAMFTSTIQDIRTWIEGPSANPTIDLKNILQEYNAANKVIGVEWESHGLTGRNALQLQETLRGFCRLQDASELVSELRMVKSKAELSYVEKAAQLADNAYDNILPIIKQGVYEGDILAELQGSIYRSGGDDPANEVVIGSGPGALMARYYSGRRHLEANDQLTLEWAGVYRHYHYVLMKTFLLGDVHPRLKELYALCEESLLASEASLMPGKPLGEAHAAYMKTFNNAGHKGSRLNACGYCLGATYAPTWMDYPMLYGNNPIVAQPGMVFFVQTAAFDEEKGLAMTLGRTSIITNEGVKALSKTPLSLDVC